MTDTTPSGKDELAARIGAVARERRKAAGMTLSDIAKSAGMSVSHLSNVENGLTLVSLPMLAKLASALDTSIADLTRDDHFVFRSTVLPTAPGTSEALSHPALSVESEGSALGPGQTRTVPTNGDRDVFIYVVEGEISVTLDGQSYTLATGDALDARSPSTAEVTASAESRLFWATTPAVRVD